MKIATPRLAPELTPRTYGPAKGLRKRVCINNPLTASDIPASRATTAFMRRMSRTILAVTGSHAPPVSAAQTSRGGMLTDPTARSATKSAAVSSDSDEKSMAERDFMPSYSILR